MIGSVHGGVDFARGSWRLAHGEVNLENGLSVVFGFVGALGSGKEVLSATGRTLAAESVVPLSKAEQLALNAANGRTFESGWHQGDSQSCWVR